MNSWLSKCFGLIIGDYCTQLRPLKWKYCDIKGTIINKSFILIHCNLQLQRWSVKKLKKETQLPTQLHFLQFINKMKLFAITLIMLSYAPRICTAFGSRSMRPLSRMKTSMTLQDLTPLTVAPLLNSLSNTLSHNRFCFIFHYSFVFSPTLFVGGCGMIHFAYLLRFLACIWTWKNLKRNTK